MSAVAGRMAVQVAATYLEKEHGGKGILLGGVPGVRRGRVAIIGGGIVGQNAARMAVGLGALVNILDINVDTLAYIDDIYQGRVNTLYSDPLSIEESVLRADVVIGAVLVTGARAPRLVTEELIKKMEPGSVIVDVAVDQGGCIETCRPTTHDDPTYTVHGVIHYCVANMPGAVAAHLDLRADQLDPALRARAREQGTEEGGRKNPHLADGVNSYAGKLATYQAVAQAQGRTYTPLAEAISKPPDADRRETLPGDEASGSPASRIAVLRRERAG